MMESLTVVHHEPEQRFEIQQARGLLQYRRSRNELVLVHTEVKPELEGQGIGAELVRSALDYARRQNLKVVPRCPFAAAYIQRHWKEYGDLVDPAVRRVPASNNPGSSYK